MVRELIRQRPGTVHGRQRPVRVRCGLLGGRGADAAGATQGGIHELLFISDGLLIFGQDMNWIITQLMNLRQALEA